MRFFWFALARTLHLAIYSINDVQTKRGKFFAKLSAKKALSVSFADSSPKVGAFGCVQTICSRFL